VKFFARDDSSQVDATRTRFYSVAKLGPKQEATPEGYLACYDVPLARTGTMWYAESEILNDEGRPEITGSVDGKVQISRDEKEVFRPEHILSYAGKPVVNDHPPEAVTPQNWKRYAVGTVFNPRRSTEEPDLLLADIVVYDPETIADIRAGKRDVSCGYDTEYEQTGPGQGRQLNMLGNHVALVDSGRCGPRCAIGDRHVTGDSAMGAKSEGWLDAIMKALRHKATDEDVLGKVREAFKAKDEKAFDAALAEIKKTMDDYNEASTIRLVVPQASGNQPYTSGQGEPTRMSDEEITKGFQAIGQQQKEMKDMLDAIAKHVNYVAGGAPAAAAAAGEDKELVAELKEEAPSGASDKAAIAKDSEYLADSFQEAVSLAEILVPGIKPSAPYDKAASPKKTFDSICAFRRTALDLAYHSAEGRAMIDQLLAGKPLELAKMSCAAVRTLYRSAAGMRKGANDLLATQARQRQEQGNKDKPKAPRTLAELNEANRKFYGQSTAS
jgi:hypothetical protein